MGWVYRLVCCAYGASILLLSSHTANAAILHGIDTANDTLFSVDTDSGSVEAIGALGVEWGYGGLAFDSTGQLLGIDLNPDDFTNQLYSIDTTTGAATLVGSLNGPGRLESLAIIGGVGYAQDVSSNTLYSVDLTTGDVTVIGSHTGASVTGLTTSEGKLYGTRYYGDSDIGLDLVELDISSGQIVDVIGTHWFYDSTSLAFADDRFWTIPAESGALYELDPLNGIPTLAHSGLPLSHVTALTGPAETFNNPEPSTCVALGGLILCFGLAGWLRQRKEGRLAKARSNP